MPGWRCLFSRAPHVNRAPTVLPSAASSHWGGIVSLRAYRAAMLAGVAFALLLFFGSGQMFGSTPDTSNKTADVVSKLWATWLADSGHRTSVIIGAFLCMLAAIALVWFAAALRTRVAPGSTPLMGFAVLAAGGIAAGTVGPLAVTGGH